MPREMIRSHLEAFDVKVGWSDGGGVQVGVETADDRPLHRTLFEANVALLGTMIRHVADAYGPTPIGKVTEPLLNASDADLGEAFLAMLDGEGSVGEDRPRAFYFRGVWSDLDRAGVNRLVRVLRRARDAAFGRDE